MIFGTPFHHALLTKALTECVTLTECGWGLMNCGHLPIRKIKNSSFWEWLGKTDGLDLMNTSKLERTCQSECFTWFIDRLSHNLHNSPAVMSQQFSLPQGLQCTALKNMQTHSLVLAVGQTLTYEIEPCTQILLLTKLA